MDRGKPDATALADVDVYVGTEALLHRVRGVDVVAFLDLDAESLPFPAILVDEQNQPDRFGTLFGTVTELGTIERSWRDEVMGRYTVLSVADPTPAFFEAMTKR